MHDFIERLTQNQLVPDELYQRELEYLYAKPERPLLPALVPTPELLPSPGEGSDESDTAVCAD